MLAELTQCELTFCLVLPQPNQVTQSRKGKGDVGGALALRAHVTRTARYF